MVTTEEYLTSNAGGLVHGMHMTPEATVCQFYYFGFKGILHCLLCGAGLIGNVLTMCILWASRMKTAMYFCLFWLAVADLLVVLQLGILSIPSAYYRQLGNIKMFSALVSYQTVYLAFSISASLLFSNWLTVIVTWQRYVSVCLPYKVKTYCTMKVTKMQVLLVCIGSILFAFPRIFESQIKPHHPGSDIIKPKFTKFATSWSYSMLYSMILKYTLEFGLPIVLLSMMTSALLWTLRKTKMRRDAMTTSSNDKHRGLNTSLIIVVIVFIICRIFEPIRAILIFLYADMRHCGQVLFFFEVWSQTTAITNSAVNFLIYIVFAKKFRQKAKETFRHSLLCHLRRVGPQPPSVSTNLTDVPKQSL